MKRPRVVDIIKSFFTGVTWYLLAMHLSLFFIFTVLLLLVNEKTLLWAGAEVITALLLAVFFAVMYKLIVEPLNEINKAARVMSHGNLEYKLRVKTDGEHGQLAKSLNEMAHRLKESLFKIRDAGNLEQAILNSMTDGVIAINENGEILFINHVTEDLFGISQASSCGINILGIIRNFEVERIIIQALKYMAPLTREMKLLIPEPRFFVLHATPLVAYETGKGGVLLLLHDITERKKMEEMRYEFITNISHELRTPLTSLRGFLETLQDGALDDKSTASHFLDIMAKETERLTKLTDGLTKLSGIEGRRIVPSLQTISITEYINRVATMYLPHFREKQLELKVDTPPDLAAVQADPDMITQVLVNLVDNAVKHTDPGGKIFIYAKNEEDNVWVYVKDTGAGIPPDSLTRVFKRFYRVDKARSRDHGGAGLGLSIVKHIILAHGGKTMVESKEGVGSIFSFSLPVEQYIN